MVQRLQRLIRMRLGRAGSRLAGFTLFAARYRGMEHVRAARGINQVGDRAGIRGSDNCTTARVLRPRCSRCLAVGQRADVFVAQP